MEILRGSILTGVALSALFSVMPGQAQSKAPDLNGVWQAPYTNNLARPLGHELPMNAAGLAGFTANRDSNEAYDPSASCLPVGPARGIQAPLPFQIVQTPNLIIILFEYQRTYRLIYMDGREHPRNNDPEWFGFSTGKWEDDTLVVNTSWMNDRTWLDTAGHIHSDKLKLTERFRKVSPEVIKWTVTWDDPVNYTEPFTIPFDLTRQNTMIMSYSCEENEKDLREHHLPGK